MKLSRYRHDSNLSYAFGATLVFELLQTKPQNITRIFLRPISKYGDDLQNILKEAKKHNIEIVESAKAFNILGAKDKCLLIAEFTKFASPIASNQPHIVLVNPSDTGNLGTIMRSAVAFGYNSLVIIGQSADHFDPKTIRASMGTVFHLNIEHFDSIEDYRKLYPKHQLFAFMLDARSIPFADIVARHNDVYSLIFGNEAAGLPSEYADFCQPVILKQSKKVDSLNLSTAASIAMYGLYRAN